MSADARHTCTASLHSCCLPPAIANLLLLPASANLTCPCPGVVLVLLVCVSVMCVCCSVCRVFHVPPGRDPAEYLADQQFDPAQDYWYNQYCVQDVWTFEDLCRDFTPFSSEYLKVGRCHNVCCGPNPMEGMTVVHGNCA